MLHIKLQSLLTDVLTSTVSRNVTVRSTESYSLSRRCALRMDLQQASATRYMMTLRCEPRQAYGGAQLRIPPQAIMQPCLTKVP